MTVSNSNTTMDQAVQAASDVDLSKILSANFMLCTLTVRVWGAAKTDRDAGEGLSSREGADTNALSVIKKLLAGNDKPLKDAQSAYTAVRTWFYANTLPWTDANDGYKRGRRLVGALDLAMFLAEFAKLKAQATQALQAFKQVYPSLCQKASGSLGGLWNPKDYPSVDEVVKAFSANLKVEPVPDQQDFSRLTLPAKITEGLQKVYERSARAQVQNAMEDFNKRLEEQLTRMHGQLSRVSDPKAADADEKRQPKLYKSLLTGLQGLVDMAKSLAPINAEMTELAKRIETELLQHQIEDFRDNVSLSQVIAARAEKLRNDLRGPVPDDGAGATADAVDPPKASRSKPKAAPKGKGKKATDTTAAKAIKQVQEAVAAGVASDPIGALGSQLKVQDLLNEAAEIDVADMILGDDDADL